MRYKRKYNGAYILVGYAMAWLQTRTSSDFVIDPGVSGGGGNDLLKVDGSQHITGALRIGNETITTGTHTDAQLFVDGKIAAKSCVVTTSNWADDVFEEKYKLATLEELYAFINKNKHLPGIPCESDVCNEGIDMSRTITALLRKIEELTLYQIQINERMKVLESQLH